MAGIAIGREDNTKAVAAEIRIEAIPYEDTAIADRHRLPSREDSGSLGPASRRSGVFLPIAVRKDSAGRHSAIRDFADSLAAASEEAPLLDAAIPPGGRSSIP